MSAQYPGIGFPPDSQVSLLRKLVNNTALIAESIPAGTPGNFVPVGPVAASSAAPGALGDMAVDESYLYVYSPAAAAWLKVALNGY